MYIVTDLTRFSNRAMVCTALVDLETGRCVRPLPYFEYNAMKASGILPGAIFTGKFNPKSILTSPHLEDCDYSSLTYHGPGTRAQFQQILDNSIFPSIVDGFEYRLSDGEKVIPKAHKGPRSLITLKASPQQIEILPDAYDSKKIKLNFTDIGNKEYRYLPITDLGFSDHARAHNDAGDLKILNSHIKQSEHVYLRVGLSREYKAPNGREGYWVQINGIYTFPSKLNLVRGYA